MLFSDINQSVGKSFSVLSSIFDFYLPNMAWFLELRLPEGSLTSVSLGVGIDFPTVEAELIITLLAVKRLRCLRLVLSARASASIPITIRRLL